MDREVGPWKMAFFLWSNFMSNIHGPVPYNIQFAKPDSRPTIKTAPKQLARVREFQLLGILLGPYGLHHGPWPFSHGPT